MSVTMKIEAPAGHALRVDLTHRTFTEPAVVDLWLVEFNDPQLIRYDHGEAHLARQFGILLIHLDGLGGNSGWPRMMDSTHAITVAPLAREWHPGYLDDGVVPEPLEVEAVARVDFGVETTSDARAVARAAAGAAIRGVMPVGGRLTTSAWHHGILMAATAVNQARFDQNTAAGSPR